MAHCSKHHFPGDTLLSRLSKLYKLQNATIWEEQKNGFTHCTRPFDSDLRQNQPKHEEAKAERVLLTENNPNVNVETERLPLSGNVDVRRSPLKMNEASQMQYTVPSCGEKVRKLLFPSTSHKMVTLAPPLKMKTFSPNILQTKGSSLKRSQFLCAQNAQRKTGVKMADEAVKIYGSIRATIADNRKPNTHNNKEHVFLPCLGNGMLTTTREKSDVQDKRLKNEVEGLDYFLRNRDIVNESPPQYETILPPAASAATKTLLPSLPPLGSMMGHAYGVFVDMSNTQKPLNYVHVDVMKKKKENKCR